MGTFLFGGGGGDAERLKSQAQNAGMQADRSQRQFNNLGAEAMRVNDSLAQYASGQRSIAAQQGQQALQQLAAQQQSAALGASPANAAMAARNAMIQGGRVGVGIAGQTQMAAQQEQLNAAKAMADIAARQRQLELQAMLDSRASAMGAYNAGAQADTGFLGKFGPTIASTAAMVASDRRLKKKAKKRDLSRDLDKLEGYEFDYRDERYGAGRQAGVMAQDLERAGWNHAVIDTPAGKIVDGGKLATTLAGSLAGLHRRLAKLEGGR